MLLLQHHYKAGKLPKAAARKVKVENCVGEFHMSMQKEIRQHGLHLTFTTPLPNQKTNLSPSECHIGERGLFQSTNFVANWNS